MPGRRDRQELGQTLDHAHHGGFQQQHQVHKRSSKNLGGLSLLGHGSLHKFDVRAYFRPPLTPTIAVQMNLGLSAVVHEPVPEQAPVGLFEYRPTTEAANLPQSP
jgi:hypothetical protein